MAGKNAPKLADFGKNLAVFRLTKLPLTIVTDSEKLNGNAFLSMFQWNSVLFQCDKKFCGFNFV
jgi:hypothetical protein